MSREQIIAELTGAGGPFEIRQTSVNDVTVRVFANAPASMRNVFEGTQAFGNREFLVYQDERWTFDEHYRRVVALTHLLLERGIKKATGLQSGCATIPSGSWRSGHASRLARSRLR
jgi:long-chain acyl-CoA synthetase